MNEELIGLVPAAGKGVRLGLPYPKELYPIIRQNRYKPVAQFILDNITAAGVRHVAFVINETKHQLMGFFGNGNRFDCDITYAVQEAPPQTGQSRTPGLAHGMDAAYHQVRGKTVVFGMADTIMRPEDVFSQILSVAAEYKDDDAFFGLFHAEYPEKAGMVRMDEDRRILEIVDKPQHTDLTEMWGCLVWRPPFTEHWHDCVANQDEGDYGTIMNLAIKAGLRLRGVSIPGGTYTDLGTYEELSELDRRFRIDGHN